MLIFQILIIIKYLRHNEMLKIFVSLFFKFFCRLIGVIQLLHPKATFFDYDFQI